MMRYRCFMGVVAAVAAWAPALGYEFRVRFVERRGAADEVLKGNVLIYPGGENSRIRVQIGVFDDAEGPAPEGGVVGWINGIQENVFITTWRTPGRLRAFAAGEGNGLPSEDPFVRVTGVNAVRDSQVLTWGCVEGAPMPMPQPVVLGRNTYVSVWEVTVESSLPLLCLPTLEVSGELVAASSWGVVGKPEQPECGEPPAVTMVEYEAERLPPRAFSATLLLLHGPGGLCSADWNGDLVLDSRDFFDYVDAFLNGRGEFDCIPGTNSQDFFSFVAAFFAGC